MCDQKHLKVEDIQTNSQRTLGTGSQGLNDQKHLKVEDIQTNSQRTLGTGSQGLNV